MFHCGKKVRYLLKEIGKSPVDLAIGIDSPIPTVRGWMRLPTLTLDNIEKICGFLNIPLWEFFIEDENELNQYLPAYITDEDVKIIKTLNLKIDGEQRKEIKLIFEKILSVVLQSYPTKQ